MPACCRRSPRTHRPGPGRSRARCRCGRCARPASSTRATARGAGRPRRVAKRSRCVERPPVLHRGQARPVGLVAEQSLLRVLPEVLEHVPHAAVAAEVPERPQRVTGAEPCPDQEDHEVALDRAVHRPWLISAMGCPLPARVGRDCAPVPTEAPGNAAQSVDSGRPDRPEHGVRWGVRPRSEVHPRVRERLPPARAPTARRCPSRSSTSAASSTPPSRSGTSVATVRWALMYPDAYEVGLPNQGVQILYEVLNERDWILAERVVRRVARHGAGDAARTASRSSPSTAIDRSATSTSSASASPPSSATPTCSTPSTSPASRCTRSTAATTTRS